MTAPAGEGGGAAVESALAVLLGERLRYVGRASDLVWFGFGPDVEAPRWRGGTRVRARHAVHLQCPWRLTRSGEPVVGNWDVYRPVGSDDHAEDELLPGAAAFDLLAERLTTEAEHHEQLVERVVADNWGGFSMELSGGLTLEVMPVTTAAEECWRYFTPGDEADHFVVFDRDR